MRMSLPVGGEVPMAFVVLTSDAARRVKQDPQMAERIKESIVKVWAWYLRVSRCRIDRAYSMLLRTRSDTNILSAVWSSSGLFLSHRAGSCCVEFFVTKRRS